MALHALGDPGRVADRRELAEHLGGAVIERIGELVLAVLHRHDDALAQRREVRIALARARR